MIRLSTWKDGLAWKEEAEQLARQLAKTTTECNTLVPQVETLRPQVETLRPQVETLRPQVETLRPQVDKLTAERDQLRRWWHEERSSSSRLKQEVAELREALQIEMAKAVPQSGPISPQPPGVHLPLAFPEQLGSERQLSARKALAFLSEMSTK